MKRVASAAVAVAITVAFTPVLAGCGSGVSDATPTVDRKEVEGLLVQRQRERNPRLRVDSASCPDGVAARTGESFDCTVLVEGVQAPFTVTIAEVLGSQVRYNLQSRLAILDVAGIADFVRSRLEDQWRSARIDCGDGKVRLVPVGGALECTLSNGTTTRHVQAVVEDLDGTVTLQER